MKNILRSNKSFFSKVLKKKNLFYKYNLKYKGILRRLKFLLRRTKKFSLIRYFFRILFLGAFAASKKFYVFKFFLDKFFKKLTSKSFLFFKKYFLYKYFIKKSFRISFKKFFFKRSFSLKTSITQQLFYVVSFIDKNFLLNKKFLRRDVSFFNKSFFARINLLFQSVIFSFSNLSVFYARTFLLSPLKGFSDKVLNYIKCNLSLFNNSCFDYVNVIVSDTRSFLSLNPILLNYVLT